MMLRRSCCALVIFLLLRGPAGAAVPGDSLRSEIERALKPAGGRVGVAMKVLERGDTLTINGDGQYPMQSVYKFPLALAILREVDRGNLSLNQRIELKPADLRPNTWSPLRKKYPNGVDALTLDELLRYTVSFSDNNGCDILMRLIGGPAVVNEYVHSLGIADIAIVSTEEEMHRAWDVQFRNWSSPGAMAALFEAFHTGNILSEERRDYLWRILANAGTGRGRLKAGLPEGVTVAHKTGSSGTDEHGMTPATNDAGIIVLPNGEHVVLVVFVSNSAADEQTRNEVIAKIARAVWDAYAGPE